MFSLLSGFFQWFFENPTFKLLLIGEEQVGKTVY